MSMALLGKIIFVALIIVLVWSILVGLYRLGHRAYRHYQQRQSR